METLYVELHVLFLSLQVYPVAVLEGGKPGKCPGPRALKGPRTPCGENYFYTLIKNEYSASNKDSLYQAYQLQIQS